MACKKTKKFNKGTFITTAEEANLSASVLFTLLLCLFWPFKLSLHINHHSRQTIVTLEAW